jgi:hypothetical protein
MQNLQQWKMARSLAVFVIVVGFSVGFVSPTAQAQNYLSTVLVLQRATIPQVSWLPTLTTTAGSIWQ